MTPEEVTADQNSPEWFLERLGFATASEFHNIVSKRRDGQEAAGRRNYRAQLVIEQLTGKRPSRFVTSEMDWGRETEELAVVTYMLDHPELDIKKCGLFKHPFLQAGASPDRVIGDDGLIEVKCFNSANHLETLHTGKVPNHHMPQVQGQLWITDRKFCKFLSFEPDMPPESQLVVVHVERDQKYIDNLMVDVSNFLKEVQSEVQFVNNYKRSE